MPAFTNSQEQEEVLRRCVSAIDQIKNILSRYQEARKQLPSLLINNASFYLQLAQDDIATCLTKKIVHTEITPERSSV